MILVKSVDLKSIENVVVTLKYLQISKTILVHVKIFPPNTSPKKNSRRDH